ncbi:hypothetical protein [Niveispirillum fermenti]
MNGAKLATLAVLAGILGAGGGYVAGTLLPPSPDTATAAGPVKAAVAPLIVPIWQQGRITGFVAMELAVDLEPGSDPGLLLPAIRDRLLGDLYEIGAQGGMQPGRVDPAHLQALLLHAIAAASGGQARGITVNKLILQENRRQGT